MTLLTSLLNPSSESGIPIVTIFAASDFPTLAEVQIGTPQYVVINPAGVIDNDPTKTNTGQFFPNATVMFWNGTNYTVVPGSGGDVVGPASVTPDALAVFDGPSGKLIKGSNVNIANVLSALTAGANITLTPITGGYEIAATGGGSAPGGIANSLQLNNGAGGFAGYSDFTYDPGTKSLTVFNLNSQGQWTLNESGVRAFFLQAIGGKLEFSSNDNNGFYNFDNTLYSTAGGFVTGGYGNVILNNDGLTINAGQQGNADIKIYDETTIKWYDHGEHIISIGPKDSISGIFAFNGATNYTFDKKTNAPIFELPATDNLGNGAIYQDGFPVFHTYSLPSIYVGQTNLFVGKNAGNFTMTNADTNGPTGNVAFGELALRSITNPGGNVNCAFGVAALHSLQGGGANIGFGATTGYNLINGDNNTLIGNRAAFFATNLTNCTIIGDSSGGEYTGGESQNIIIRNDGVAGESGVIRFGDDVNINKAFIAGIKNSTIAANNKIQIIEGTTGQLGALADGTAGQTLTTNGAGVVSWQSSPTFTPETPSGAIDGVNVTFTLANTPLYIVGLFLNGAYQTDGADYTISGTTITFTTAPAAGVLTATYYY